MRGVDEAPARIRWGFVLWELRVDEPLLDVTAFKNRGLASGSLTITTMFAVMFGVFLVLFPFFQTILGYSALRSASGLLPMAAAMMIMSSVAPRSQRGSAAATR